ncbi:protein FAM161A [Megalops cyprinoides]|uniref:protein FAM161A n=1 Tax=Megalops cyprinoides TaxID=118141 RepID=UPI0018656836|nr:protein FAM161A [Megalops cyprinoides]
MEKSHRTNVLVTSCLKTPVDPHTKVPLALYERQRALPYAPGQTDNRNYEKEMEYDSESESSDGEDPRRNGNPLLMKNCRVSGEHIDLREFYFSNEEYYKKLEELKRAHLRTMAELEGMYRKKMEIKGAALPDNETGNAEGMHRSQLESIPMAMSLRKAFSAQELNQTGASDMSDSSEEGMSENDAEVAKDLLLSPRAHIRNMWQGFTVGELTPRNRHPSWSSLKSQPAGHKGRGAADRERKEDQRGDGWRPGVTVPRPFRMTLREAEKKRRNVKSRSEVELENALLKKQLEELTECQKKFRASPVPAHVYLPLYEEMTARNEERRQLFRQCNQELLRAYQKPFSFIERERRKKEERAAQLQDLPSTEERRTFKAKPVPRSVYDSTVSEQIKEDQLYRAIKMQMRAQELLHSASMPRSMLAKRLSDKRRETAERTVETEADFRPKINGEVPDLDASYRRFKKRLQNKRDVKPVTVCEPFQLRTAQISSHRERVLADMEVQQASPRVTRWPYTASSSPYSSPLGSQEFLPAKITDAAKKRQEAVRKVLEQRKKEEEEEEKWRQRQKQRERKLQKVVTRRAQANDPHLALSQTSKTKLKQFRQQDLQRRKEYREEMREILERVKGRPLLLEQVTQRNAKQAAEKRYAEKLRGYGISEDFVSRKAPKQLQLEAPNDISSLYSEERHSGSAGPDDYADDYEECDDQESCGDEKEAEEDEHKSKRDTEEEEEEDKADQSDQEDDRGEAEDGCSEQEEQEGREEENEAKESPQSNRSSRSGQSTGSSGEGEDRGNEDENDKD